MIRGNELLREIARTGLSIALLVTICFMFATANGCSSGDEGCALVKFTLTPDGGTAFEVTSLACQHEPSTDGCRLEIFLLSGNDRYFQYGTEAGCLGVFEARIEHQQKVYFLQGDTQRTFGFGMGPFATGTYTEEGIISDTFGLFEFDEFKYRKAP